MLHKNIPLGDNHIVINWSVADSTARLAIVTVADDIHKICYQLAGSGYYTLTARGTPDTWTLLNTAALADTDALTEGAANLYFTAARVRATVLTGISFAAATVVTAAHTILQAIGFLQKQVSNNATDIATNTASIATNAAKLIQMIPIAASDESTALTTGIKVTFRMPYALTLTAIKASLTTAQATGAIFTIDMHKAGTTIFSTKPTIDNTEKTTATAATASVLSTTAIAADDEIDVEVQAIGDGTAKGLKVYLLGTLT